jgi:hypothetical protein
MMKARADVDAMIAELVRRPMDMESAGPARESPLDADRDP